MIIHGLGLDGKGSGDRVYPGTYHCVSQMEWDGMEWDGINYEWDGTGPAMLLILLLLFLPLRSSNI